MQVGNGVHRLTQGVTNFYLIEDSGRFTVVDTGTPKDWAHFVQALTEIGARPADVEAVLLTHAHSDHVGFAEQARAEAGSRVWIHQADAEAARTGKAAWKNDGKARDYVTRGEFWRTLFSLSRRGAMRMIPVKEVSAFGDGERIDVPGRPRAVHAPGHTPGSAALLLEDRRVLLAGDVMCTKNPLTGRMGPQIMPSGLNQDSRRALASLASIEDIAADVLLPGHGEPWHDGVAEAVKRARAAGLS